MVSRERYIYGNVEQLGENCKKYWNEDRLNRVFVSLLSSLLLLILLNVILREQNLGWFLESRCWTSGGILSTEPSRCATNGGTALGEIGIVLGPLFAIALAIERVVEILLLISKGDADSNSLKNFQQRMRELRDSAFNHSAMSNDDWHEIREQLSQKEEEFLEKISPYFTQVGSAVQFSKRRKKAITFSFLIGVSIAVLTDIGLFLYLNIPVPRFIDLLITGIVLGAGAGPLHSFVGVLDGLKGLLNRDTAVTTKLKSEEFEAMLKTELDSNPA